MAEAMLLVRVKVMELSGPAATSTHAGLRRAGGRENAAVSPCL